MNAYDELLEFLDDNEYLVSIVFGEYGWGDDVSGESWGFPADNSAKPVPSNKKFKVLTFQEAKPLMDGWSFYNTYGIPKCYAVTIWTNKRVIWVTQYDGSTKLSSAPRNPIDHVPTMPGS